MKLKPEGREDPDKVEHHITLYPTVVVLPPDGREVGRIEGYRDPSVFLRQVRRMRRGRVLEELVESVRRPGGTHADLVEAVERLRDGWDFFRALEILRSFHGREKLSCCRGVTWRTELDLQAVLYEEAGPWALGRVATPPFVSTEPYVAALAGIVEAEAARTSGGNRASLVREARRLDTSALCARAPLADLSPQDASDAAERLYTGGYYAGAARLWQRAVAGGVAWGGVEYYRAAARLFAVGTDLAVAERWAGKTIAATVRDGENTILATMLLARIQKARGEKVAAAATARREGRGRERVPSSGVRRDRPRPAMRGGGGREVAGSSVRKLAVVNSGSRPLSSGRLTAPRRQRPSSSTTRKATFTPGSETAGFPSRSSFRSTRTTTKVSLRSKPAFWRGPAFLGSPDR